MNSENFYCGFFLDQYFSFHRVPLYPFLYTNTGYLVSGKSVSEFLNISTHIATPIERYQLTSMVCKILNDIGYEGDTLFVKKTPDNKFTTQVSRPH